MAGGKKKAAPRKKPAKKVKTPVKEKVHNNYGFSSDNDSKPSTGFKRNKSAKKDEEE